MAVTEAEYRRRLKQAHLCVVCHQQDAYTMNGRYRCADCAEKHNQWNREKYAANKEEYRAKEREKKMQRVKEGKCRSCGKELPPDYAYKQCECCRTYHRKKAEKRRREAGVFPRGQYGICYICNKRPCSEGKGLCAKCYERSVQDLKKTWETNDTKNSVAAKLNNALFESFKRKRRE